MSKTCAQSDLERAEGKVKEFTMDEDTLVGEAMLSPRNGMAKKAGEQKKEEQQTSSKKGKSESTQRLKRPMNAFMVWSSLERKRLAEREPHLHNTELSKRLGEIWKGMSEDMKKPYRDEAQKLKAKLMEEHPDYKYRPRRRKDIGNLRHSNSLFGGSSGSYLTGQPTINGNDYMKLYSVNHQSSSQIGYTTRNIPTNNFVSEKGYMYPYPAYMNTLPQAQFSHLGALQLPHPVYTGGYIAARGQGHILPSSTQFLSYQNSPNIQGIITQQRDRPAQLLTSHATNEHGGVAYKDVSHVNNSSLCHTVCSGEVPNLQNHPQHQLTNDHSGEYSMITSTKQEPSVGCDKNSFTHHTLTNGETVPIQSSHIMLHRMKPFSPSAIETPPCSPCVASNSIQTYSNTVSSNCTHTKVCTSPLDKQCPVSSPCLSDGQSTFSLVTPSPDNPTPIAGPSPSSEDTYTPEYYSWNQIYGNNFQVKNDPNSNKEAMYASSVKPDSIPPLYHSDQHDIKPVLYSVECGQYDYRDRNEVGNSYYSENGIQDINDEDSLGSSSQILSHEPDGLVVGYRPVINGGIPTPELTPTDRKCTVLTADGDRNMFF